MKFMSIARQRAGLGSVELTSEANKLKDVLKTIIVSYKLADIILTKNGEVKPWTRVLVNGRSQEFIGGLDLELRDGDTVALIYPYTENF